MSTTWAAYTPVPSRYTAPPEEMNVVPRGRKKQRHGLKRYMARKQIVEISQQA
jgi:hypothetical protein